MEAESFIYEPDKNHMKYIYIRFLIGIKLINEKDLDADQSFIINCIKKKKSRYFQFEFLQVLELRRKIIQMKKKRKKKNKIYFIYLFNLLIESFNITNSFFNESFSFSNFFLSNVIDNKSLFILFNSLFNLFTFSL